MPTVYRRGGLVNGGTLPVPTVYKGRNDRLQGGSASVSQIGVMEPT